jgi:RNA polymerase-binding transcription factor DksA
VDLSFDKQTFVQHLLRGRERVLLTSAAAQRSLPFDDSGVHRGSPDPLLAGESLADMLDDLRGREVSELAAIRRALARVEGGTYGRCVRCGVEIGAARLQAQPAATHCVHCLSVRERLR